MFYTYIHTKPNGYIFYVGKGKGVRAYDLVKRNKWHKRIVEKYGKENIRIFVFPCDSEEESLRDEIIQIAQLRKEGYELCNLTDGGQGLSGHNPSEETRKKLSIKSNGNKGPSTINHAIPHSEETKLKCSKSQKERWNNPEIREIYMNSRKNGLSKETKEKISNSLKGNIPWNKKVISDNLEV